MSSQQPLPAAQRPIAAGLLSVLGVTWSLLLLVLGVICIRDALLEFGAVTGSSWIAGVANSLDGTFATRWMYVIGALCCLIGLFLLAAAIKPRPRRGIEVEAETGVLISKSAVERLAASAAGDVDGVDTVSASASRGRVSVNAAVLSATNADEVRSDITKAVEERLGPLRRKPQVRVRTKITGEDR